MRMAISSQKSFLSFLQIGVHIVVNPIIYVGVISAEKPVDIVYLDFQKAFDKVPHQRLLLKLKARGIGSDVINWIEKWLTHTEDRE